MAENWSDKLLEQFQGEGFSLETQAYAGELLRLREEMRSLASGEATSFSFCTPGCPSMCSGHPHHVAEED